MAGTISRRSAVGLLGLGTLAGALATKVAGVADEEPGAAGSVALQPGQRFGRWTIAAVHPLQDGALDVTVKGADDRPFTLQVLARDASPLALTPPAATAALAIFVHNAGDGWLPTEEEQGLAAMTLAHVLESNGQGGPVAGLLTHAEHILRHRASLAAGGGERPSRTT